MTILPPIRDKKDEELDECTEAEEDDEVVFDQTPVRVLCPHCGGAIITFIEYESTWVTYATALVIWIVLGWAAICVVPVVWPLFKDVVHHCPRCLNILATKSRVVLPSFRQQVMTFKVGSCAVVLARRYVIFLCSMIGVIFLFYFLRSAGRGPGQMEARGPESDLRWDDFLKDCGYRSYLGNPIHVSAAFEEKFQNRTFSWHGTTKRYQEPIHFLGWRQLGLLYVRMEPSQFPNKHELPDLVLTFDSDAPVAAEVDKFRPNRGVDFVGTMYRVGKRGAPHAMALWSLTYTSEGGSLDAKGALKNGTGHV